MQHEINNITSIDKLRKIKDVTSDYIRDLELELANSREYIARIQRRIEDLSVKT